MCFVLSAIGLSPGWDVDEYGEALPSYGRPVSPSKAETCNGFHLRVSFPGNPTHGRLVSIAMTIRSTIDILDLELNQYRLGWGQVLGA